MSEDQHKPEEKNGSRVAAADVSEETRRRFGHLKGGLIASVIIAGFRDDPESRAEFEAILLELAEMYQPAGLIEEIAVQDLAGCCWRLKQHFRIERERVLSTPIADLASELSIMRYEGDLLKSVSMAAKILERIQRKRIGRARPRRKDA